MAPGFSPSILARMANRPNFGSPFAGNSTDRASVYRWNASAIDTSWASLANAASVSKGLRGRALTIVTRFDSWVVFDETHPTPEATTASKAIAHFMESILPDPPTLATKPIALENPSDLWNTP